MKHIESIPEAPGVVICDISERIAALGFTPQTRKLESVDKLFVHHSGRGGRPGADGAFISARFAVKMKKMRTPPSRRMPPYHYWIPEEPEREGQVVIYRMAPHEWRCWHTGGEANGRGIGIACQGNKTDDKPTWNQEEALEALIPHLYEKYLRKNGVDYHSDWLSWHSDSKRFGGSGKKHCPGKHLETWLKDYRELVNKFPYEEVSWT